MVTDFETGKYKATKPSSFLQTDKYKQKECVNTLNKKNQLRARKMNNKENI